MKNQLVVSLFELGLFVIIAIITVFLTKFILTKFYKRKTGKEFPYKNIAFMIFMSSSIIAVSILMYCTLGPLSGTMQVLTKSDAGTGTVMLEFIKFLFLFLFIGYLLGIIVNFLAYKLFTALTTKLDEFKEISDGNIGVAILASVFVIVIAVFAKEPFIWFLESMIPYPELPGFY